MKKKEPVDKRRFVRFNLGIKVNFQVKEKGKGKASLRKISGISKNICLEGVCFTSKSKLESGSKLELEIFLPSEPEPLRLEGEVIWCHLIQAEKDRVVFDTGVKLFTINKDDKGRLISHILNKHKELEKALQESERRYRTLLKNIPQKIFYKDLNSVYLLCNESFADDLNIHPDEIKGKTDYDFFDRKLAEKYRADDKRIVQNGKREEIEERYVRVRDGKEIIVNTIKAPVRNEKNNIIGVFGIFWNITERKKAEQELKKSEANYRAIFASANDAIFIHNVETGDIIDVNQRMCEIYGYRREEARRLNVESLSSGEPPYTQKEALNWIKKAVKGKPQLFEWYAKDKYGRLFWVEVNLKRVVIGGIGRLLAVVRDITERKRAEEKFKKAINIKSEFISMVSHELRTPLTAIQEGIGIVLDRVCGNINIKQRKYLDIAKRNLDRLSRLINSVLDFQKLEAGKVEFNVQKNDINEAIKDVKRTMTTLAHGKGLNFELRLSKRLPKVKFDKDRITQVITNIIDNAIKFTKRGDIIVTTDKKDNTIHVAIQDTGCGIKKEDMPRLFHKFQQLQTIEERQIGGTGLGLAISKEIIERHKGKIWAESRFGQGTTFHFVLPIAEKRG